jgi:protein-S-isoprenylcysteine O-methyltransferase Ste14
VDEVTRRPDGQLERVERGRSISASGLAAAFTNLCVALLYLLFAYAHLAEFQRHRRPSLVLVVVLEALFALFFLLRRPAERTSFSPWDVLTTLGGTFAPLLLRPTGVAHDVVIGQMVQSLGAALAIGGILSLNRSIGLLPAHRAIKSAGLYRWVRHPLYSAYTVANVGYLASNASLHNAALVVAALGFQLLRIRSEERFLSRYAAYGEYRARTRWRLIPFVY